MKTRNKLIISLVLSVFSLIGGNAAEMEKQPNIIFLFADDLSYEAVGSASKGLVKTPNLDKLGDQGCTFSQAFNPGSWTPAVCVASRTMLETGRSVWKAAKYKPKKDTDQPLWSQLMKSAGYETYFTGKWHVNGLDPRNLFDHTGTVRGGMPQQSSDGYARKFAKGETDKWTPDNTKYGGYWEGGRHWSEVAADEACGFIDKASGEDKPFFLYVAFNAPHDPRQSARQYLNLYPVNKIPLPAAFLPEYPYKDQIGCGKKLRDEKLAPFPRNEMSIKTNRREYYSIISHLDAQVGRILDQVKKKVKGPTYIIFTADQGLSVGDHGLMGKQNLYEPSIRVPFFISGPGIPARATVNTPVYMQSILPTTLELAGKEKPESIVFESILNMAKSGKGDDDRDVYGAMFDSQRMIRTGDWKLLMYPKANVIRLYNRKIDPAEIKDVAHERENIPVIRDLYKRFKELQKQNDDVLNLDDLVNTYTSAGN